MKKQTYYCLNCGNTYTEDDAYWAGSYEGEGVMRGWLVDAMLCPECLSEEWTEAAMCDACGEWFPAEDTKQLEGYTYCAACYEKEKAGVAAPTNPIE